MNPNGPCVLRIVGAATAAGDSRFDGQYIVRYEHYGNRLFTAKTANEARVFSSFGAAYHYWRTSYGLRPDGRPNRPLTAFHVSIESAGQGQAKGAPEEEVRRAGE